jgi:enamine deaminase RidA (YjgF/YER057c/UK114 family)
VSVRRVNPDGLARPVGYSHATVATGQVVFLAGQTALDATGAIVGGTVVAQFERALGNLLTALGAAGGSPEHLASVTIYATDVPDYRANAAEIGAVWRRLAGREYPAMALIGVDRLWDAEAVVELQGFAVLP